MTRPSCLRGEVTTKGRTASSLRERGQELLPFCAFLGPRVRYCAVSNLRRLVGHGRGRLLLRLLQQEAAYTHAWRYRQACQDSLRSFGSDCRSTMGSGRMEDYRQEE